MLKRVLIIVLLLTGLATAQDSHKFWDKQNKVTFWATAGVRAIDIAQTCYLLQTYKGWHERMLPAQSCGAATAWIVSGQGTQTLVQYGLHKLGHHKLERYAPWFWVAPNAYGISISLYHARR